MRTGYSISKVVTFTGLALSQVLAEYPADPRWGGLAATLLRAMQYLAWIAVAFCVLRGLPVIVRSLRRYWSTPADATPG
jgi:hypothetical protein